jgi:hypothetical protein
VINAEGIATEVEVATAVETDATAEFTFNADTELSGVTARASDSDVTSPRVTFTGTGVDGEITQFSTDAEDYNVGFYTAEKADGSASGVVASAVAHGWNYQSFGAWVIAANGPAPQHVVVQTGGAVTEIGDVPPTGSAHYAGRSAGVLHNEAGQIFDTRSDVTADVDFGTRDVEFATSGTSLNERGSELPPINGARFDLTGTLRYEAGSNRFMGMVTTVGSEQTGTADGVFYGPAAQEIGGTFAVESYIGAFGAAQQPAAE